MWPFNQFPKDAVQQKHKFEVTGEFLNNLRLASVQVGGGSGSFVSPNGLLLTNQHIVAGCIADLKNGFYAPAQPAETRCPRLEAAVLVKIEDVTAQVKAATPATLEQRNAVIAKVEKACSAGSRDRTIRAADRNERGRTAIGGLPTSRQPILRYPGLL